MDDFDKILDCKFQSENILKNIQKYLKIDKNRAFPLSLKLVDQGV